LLVENINSLKSVKLYLISYMPLKQIQEFDSEFHLNEHHNIIVGQDFHYSFARIFRPAEVPYLAVYDDKHRLVRIYKGNTSVRTIAEALHS
jgi:hypothetical protein